MNPALKCRVVSYNVLSDSLCGPEGYTHSDPAVLDNAARWEQVRRKVELEAEHGSVICLQEVSLVWTGKLHAVFAALDYHVVVSNYGGEHEGYLGVLIAFPRSKYKLVRCEILRVSDTKQGGYSTCRQSTSKADVEQGQLVQLARNGVLGLKSLVLQLWTTLFKWAMPASSTGGGTKTPSSSYNAENPYNKHSRVVEDVWCESQKQVSRIVMVHLRPMDDRVASRTSTSSAAFCAGVYHMPCIFWEPKFMTIHTALAAQCMERFAGELPFVLTGDWNLLPDSAQVKMLLEGNMAVGHAEHPGQCYKGDTWTPELQRPLQSAYRAVTGNEPSFTNFRHIRGMSEPFMGTLDYMFFSAGAQSGIGPSRFECTWVMPTPGKEETLAAYKSFPCATQPSDHVMIGAEWTLR